MYNLSLSLFIHNNRSFSGYQFTYPFMSTKVEIRTDDNHVEPIYKHLVHMDYTNLFFMGLPAIVIPFPMFHIQAQYILGILEGRVRLPSAQEMREEYETEKQSLLAQGIPVRFFFIAFNLTRACKQRMVIR